MLRLTIGLMGALLALDAALASDYRAAPYSRAFVLPPERHVVEGVYLPGSGVFQINNRYFTAQTPACMRWLPGEQIRLVAGDWSGACTSAVFYNVRRRETCEMWCGFSLF
jgi:hypothetical protein